MSGREPPPFPCCGGMAFHRPHCAEDPVSLARMKRLAEISAMYPETKETETERDRRHYQAALSRQILTLRETQDALHRAGQCAEAFNAPPQAGFPAHALSPLPVTRYGYRMLDRELERVSAGWRVSGRFR